MVLPKSLTDKELLRIKKWYFDSIQLDLPLSAEMTACGKLLGELSRYRACLTDQVDPFLPKKDEE